MAHSVELKTECVLENVHFGIKCCFILQTWRSGWLTIPGGAVKRSFLYDMHSIELFSVER